MVEVHELTTTLKPLKTVNSISIIESSFELIKHEFDSIETNIANYLNQIKKILEDEEE